MGATEILRSSAIADPVAEMPVIPGFSTLGRCGEVPADFGAFRICRCDKAESKIACRKRHGLTTGHIARHPGSGSSRYAHELNLPGLRFWPVQKSPHLIFYVEHSGHIDVWRVLHGHRDIPAWMREPS
ncbi:MAG TPA: type II toxin-antitoxin system RelE/ParE family toxin [Steroidobacteraceae bacterium]|nr:type II toxin-antitoxin system RelE/ParE family toxin [Steroidobacteraceae bacterium]